MKVFLSYLVIATVSIVVLLTSAVFVSAALMDEGATWKLAGKFWEKVSPPYEHFLTSRQGPRSTRPQ